ncbi:MAG: YqgE/AlgH family protein [Burkholderiales bacterium]|nr:YqgE/AlgH family protein [Burkholderiales bacterium]
MLARLCLVLWWGLAGTALGADDAAPQREAPNGALLVARPGLLDPNFRQTVVLVTQRPDGSTVGVILNRPTQLELAPLVPGLPAANYRDALYFGGPVMRRSVVAVFESSTAPASSAFHVLRDIYLSMHEANIARLLGSGGARYRLYVGFSGWGPGQLESELAREGWYVLPADPTVVFRDDTRGLWEALVARALGRSARAGPHCGRSAVAHTNECTAMKSPAGAGLFGPGCAGQCRRRAAHSRAGRCRPDERAKGHPTCTAR